MTTTLLWFRRDLRLHDNHALNWACENSESVLPVYIHAPDEEKPWAPGSASRWWLHNSLSELDKKLQLHGLRLNYFSGRSSEIISDLINETGASALVYNRLYEPHLIQRDHALENKLKQKIHIQAFESGLFFKPGSLLNKQQQPYKVFTPFYKKARPLIDTVYSHYAVETAASKLNKTRSVSVKNSITLEKLELLDKHQWHEKLHKVWTPGENTALESTELFLDSAIETYESNRDIPSSQGTSQLSPCLHFGEITPQQIFISMQAVLNGAYGHKAYQSAEIFLKQLLWREFAHHVLWHFPETTHQPMKPRFKNTFWRMNKKHLNLWTRGQTGVAIIDAGMKQLWQTGWMHNRVRMVVSSFLTKNLGINWIHGAQWFWETLVDADLANNTMGWQWIAGCGVDAAPYYRIFNPQTQTKRFDPELNYIDQWAPEHTELDSPSPMIDISTSRQSALERYKQYITD